MSIQIKIFSDEYDNILEKTVNEFIKDRDIIKIDYIDVSGRRDRINCIAIVIYKLQQST